MDASAEGLMVAHDPARVLYEQVKRRFGSDNLTVVVVKADDVFTPTVLGVVQRLTDGLERVDGVTRVDSLTTVRNIKGRDDRARHRAAGPLARAHGGRATSPASAATRSTTGCSSATSCRPTPGRRPSRSTSRAVPGRRDSGFNQRGRTGSTRSSASTRPPGVTVFQVGVP